MKNREWSAMKKPQITIFLIVISIISLDSKASEQKRLPNVLILHHATSAIGGGENNVFNRYLQLIEFGYNTIMMVPEGSPIQEKLKQKSLSHKTYNKRLTPYNFTKVLTIFPADVVMCTTTHLAVVKKIVKDQGHIKIVYVRHIPLRSADQLYALLKGIDGFIGVGPLIANEMQIINKEFNLGIKNITYIPPFFDASKFFNFTTTESRYDFFQRLWNISVKDVPIITMIGNMYENLQYKNHPLLLSAISQLIYKKGKKIEVMLAGTGPRKEYLQGLAKKLKVEQHVHFLDYVKEIPGLLYHSDIHVLTSSQEAFGQVHAEAAFMKKPSIGALGTGAVATIQHDKTGFLFQNNNVDDFVKHIEILIDQKETREHFGKNAYEHACAHFSQAAQINKLHNFFMSLYN